MADTTLACPKCDSANAIPRADSNNKDKAPENDWRCKDCKAQFDEPVRREIAAATTTDPPSHSLAADLLDMDPDDVGGSA